MNLKALIAVDLHGTIADKNEQHNGEYDPSNYTLQPGAVDALNELRADGHEVAIWTCWATDEARVWLDENKVPYDYINEEAPDHGSPKIDADAYVDDKAVEHDGDWNATLAAMYASGRLEKSMAVRITKARSELNDFIDAAPSLSEQQLTDYLEELGLPAKDQPAGRDAKIAKIKFFLKGGGQRPHGGLSRVNWRKSDDESIVTKPSGTKVERKQFQYIGKSKTGGEVWYKY